MTQTVDTGRWTDGLLDEMRGIGDPVADPAIAETYELGQEQQVRQALLGFERNRDTAPADLPPLLTDYFRRTAVLPEWAEPALIERGHGLLGRYQAHLTTTLLCASLPLCYSCGNGAEVLGRSQRLTSGVYRRLMETSQFILDVLDTGGLGPTGNGLRSAQKIRLLHATMRYHLGRGGEWDTAAWGVPVNQEDLAGTLMSFSVVIVRGLKKLGVDLPRADRDAYFHIWRVIGHILGVDDRVNPSGFDDGSRLVDAILARQQRTSDSGVSLTKSLLDFVRETLPGSDLAGVGPTLIRHLAGDQAADVLRVPKANPLTGFALASQSPLSGVYGKTGDTVPPLARLSNELGLAVFRQGLKLTNKGRRYEWQVPTGLAPTT